MTTTQHLLATLAARGDAPILVGTTTRDGDVGYSYDARCSAAPLPEGVTFEAAEGEEAVDVARTLVARSTRPATVILALAYLASHSPEAFDAALADVR